MLRCSDAPMEVTWRLDLHATKTSLALTLVATNVRIRDLEAAFSRQRPSEGRLFRSRILNRGTLVVAWLLASGCSTCEDESPHSTAPWMFQEVAPHRATCVKLQTCLPLEWRAGTWDGTLARCTTNWADISLDVPPVLRWRDTPFETTDHVDVYDEFFNCVASARGCSGVLDCLGGGECVRGRADSAAHCTGARVERCLEDGVVLSLDCATFGLECFETTAFLGGTTALCAMPCSGGGMCRESVAETCQPGGFFTYERCSDAGCSVESGVAACNRGTCEEAASSRRCDGSVVVTCNHGIAFSLSCADAPSLRRCADGSCVVTGEDCQTDEQFCVGSSVRYCEDGFWREVHCPALGFPSCREGVCDR